MLVYNICFFRLVMWVMCTLYKTCLQAQTLHYDYLVNGKVDFKPQTVHPVCIKKINFQIYKKVFIYFLFWY